MSFSDCIEIRPDILLGKPVIRGTRVPVDRIVRKLGEGAREEDLLDAYPRFERADVPSALLYAAAVLANEEAIVLEPAPRPTPHSSSSVKLRADESVSRLPERPR